MRKTNPIHSVVGSRGLMAAMSLTASSFLITTPTRAALVGYDNFDGYNTGSASGLTGGTGWTSSWSAVSGVTISSESINYTLDGEILGKGRTLRLGGTSNNAIVRALPVTGGKDVYVSFIFQIKGGTTNTAVSGNVFAGWQADDASPSYAVDNIGYVGGSGKAGARVANVSTALPGTLNYGQTYLMVIKYLGWNGSAYTKTQIWLNPSRSDEATTNTNITCIEEESAGSTAFTGLRVRTVGLDATYYHLIDELRVGTKWDDVVSPATGAPMTFVHPGITLDETDLARMKARILEGRQPEAAAYAALTPGATLLAYTSQAEETIDCRSGTDYSLHEDSRALFDLALRWYVTRDEDYADKAIEIMDDWSSTLELIRTLDDPDTYHSTHILHVAWSAHQFAEAAEIIRHTYKNGSTPVWPATKIAEFETMLKTKFYPHLPNNTTQNGNWEASIIHSIIAIGIFTNDRAIFERGTSMLRGAGRGAIGTYIYESGQCQETTRLTESGNIDLLHSQMGIGDILQACEMAWKQGVDLYSAYPQAGTGIPRMVLGMEYAAGLALGEARPLDGGRTIQFPTTPSLNAPHELLETGYNHYVHRMSHSLPTTATAMKQRRDASLFGHNRSTLTHGELSVLESTSFATAERRSLGYFGWSGWGSLASGSSTNYTSTTLPSSGSSIPRLGVHSVNGLAGDKGVLFSHSGGTSTPTGNRNDRFAVVASTDALSLSTDGLNTIVWSQAANVVSGFSTRVLVQVGSQWYASAQTYGVSTASSSAEMTNAETKIHNLWGPNGLGTTQWRTVSIGSNGSAISLGSNNVSTAIGTTISGIGLLITTDNDFNRATFIDNVRLTSFP